MSASSINDSPHCQTLQRGASINMQLINCDTHPVHNQVYSLKTLKINESLLMCV